MRIPKILYMATNHYTKQALFRDQQVRNMKQMQYAQYAKTKCTICKKYQINMLNMQINMLNMQKISKNMQRAKPLCSTYFQYAE